MERTNTAVVYVVDGYEGGDTGTEMTTKINHGNDGHVGSTDMMVVVAVERRWRWEWCCRDVDVN